MNNKQLLELIAVYSRVEITQSSLYELGEELKDINLLDFKNFIKRSLDRAELQYTPKGLERFMKFIKLYNQDINKGREAEALTKAQLLEEKFNKIKTSLKNELAKGKMPELENILMDGKSYFNNFEIRELNSIGNIKTIIKLSDCFLLAEELQKNFNAIIYAKQLPKPQAKALDVKVKRF